MEKLITGEGIVKLGYSNQLEKNEVLINTVSELKKEPKKYRLILNLIKSDLKKDQKIDKNKEIYVYIC